jgi:hypothetical protein
MITLDLHGSAPMFVGFGNPVDLSWSIYHKPKIFGSYSYLVFVSLFPATTRSLCATKSGPPTGSPCQLRSPGKLSARWGFPEMSILNIPKACFHLLLSEFCGSISVDEVDSTMLLWLWALQFLIFCLPRVPHLSGDRHESSWVGAAEAIGLLKPFTGGAGTPGPGKSDLILLWKLDSSPHQQLPATGKEHLMNGLGKQGLDTASLVT